MKLFALLFFTLVALINCVPLDAAEDFDLASREIEQNKGMFAVATLPNGRHTITVYDDGKYDGVIVEEEDGKCTIYDKDGNVVDIDDDSDDGDDEHRLRRRQHLALLRRLGAFIARFGRRAWVRPVLKICRIEHIEADVDAGFHQLRRRRHCSPMLGRRTLSPL
jgi:hypothetical protein